MPLFLLFGQIYLIKTLKLAEIDSPQSLPEDSSLIVDTGLSSAAKLWRVVMCLYQCGELHFERVNEMQNIAVRSVTHNFTIR